MSSLLLISLGSYMACGFLFGIPFVVSGVGRLDPHAGQGSWGFRLLILPGAMALWPLLLQRWVRGMNVPPEENNAHRRAVRKGRVR